MLEVKFIRKLTFCINLSTLVEITDPPPEAVGFNHVNEVIIHEYGIDDFI